MVAGGIEFTKAISNVRVNTCARAHLRYVFERITRGYLSFTSGTIPHSRAVSPHRGIVTISGVVCPLTRELYHINPVRGVWAVSAICVNAVPLVNVYKTESCRRASRVV